MNKIDFNSPYAYVGTKAVVVNDNEVLMLRRSKEVSESGKWGLPGGRLEPGEEVIEGMRREIKEETGLEVENLEVIEARSFNEEAGFVIIIFYAVRVGGKEVVLDRENDDYKWVKLDEMGELGVGPLIKEVAQLGLIRSNRK